MLFQGQTGPQVNNDGANPPARVDKTGCLVVSECHGRFFEQAYRGNVYSIGSGVAALSANTITLVAATTPILGVWNPPTSTVNLVILQAALTVYANTLTTPVGPGAFVWASSSGNGVISTGLAPFNRKTFLSAGSQAKGFSAGTALTGLTNNLIIFEGAGEIATGGPNTYSTTTALQLGGAGVQNFDGSLIVPPGAVLALLNTTSTTTMSVAGRLVWEEVAL